MLRWVDDVVGKVAARFTPRRPTGPGNEKVEELLLGELLIPLIGSFLMFFLMAAGR